MPKRPRDHGTKLKEADDMSCDDKKEFGNDRKDEQRTAANRRERLRMRVLSKAFGKLKTTLPWVPVDTKLSKLDTLRLASSYIGHLNQILVSEDGISRMSFCPENLSWPLLFDSRVMEGMIRKGQCSPDSTEGQSS